jgi:SAM-dependent methyltransferase
MSSALLIGLWRASFNVRTERLLNRVSRLGLWESPCGLAFFDPMIEGDAAFYDSLYIKLKLHEVLSAPGANRPEFELAAKRVGTGAKVLDVGGGGGGFARHVPHARYVALDPNATAAPRCLDLRAETVGQHARTHPESYDVVCAFQVVEHVTDPLLFVNDMLTCLRPGGRLLIGVPLWPSPITDIPNFAFNAPPHHLSWWTEGALHALCARLSVDVETIERLPVGSHESILCWMGRFAPDLTGQRFFRATWKWYLGLAWAWAAGRVVNFMRQPPASATPMIVLLSARKPA